MSKLLTSPVKRYPGTVQLSEPMSMPQYFAFRDARNEAAKFAGADDADWAELQQAMLPGIMACVEKWELEGLNIPPETFPSSPRMASIRLCTWLFDEIAKIFVDEEELPNE